MMLSRLSSVALAVSRRPIAFVALSRHGRQPTSLAAYSAETTRRTLGKDRLEELANMAERMQLDEPNLKKLLAKRLTTMDATTEQAEYIDWLLSSETKMKPAPTTMKTSTTPVPIQKQTAPKSKSSAPSNSGPQTFATDVQFAERSDLHPLSKRAIIEVMGLTTMTEIQARTFEAASTGNDVLGRARTGTGKTLAFLLPAIERILQSGDYHAGQNIGILIVSPTRELASQIADQAEKLLTFHPDTKVQVMFGGTNMKTDINQLNRRLPTVLVATPGRLLDHLESTTMARGGKFGKDIMSKTPVVVLDETDRLLDMGFRKAITKILNFMPRGEKRQTLLFSATIPPDCTSSGQPTF
jgi:CRISPR/Cas system-associated endonuclease/helicase Cas3